MAKAKKKTPKKKPKARKKRGPKPGGKSPSTDAGRAKAEDARDAHAKQINTDGLTDKQAAFVRHYLIHLNATKAAELAGYSKATAHTQGTQLLSHPSIRAVLAQAMDERNRRLDVAADRVLLELVCGAFANVADYVSWKKGIVSHADSAKLTRLQMASMKSVEQKFNRKGDIIGMKVTLHDKPRFLELLMRHMGMLDPTGRQDTKGTIVEFMDRLKNGKGVE